MVLNILFSIAIITGLGGAGGGFAYVCYTNKVLALKIVFWLGNVSFILLAALVFMQCVLSPALQDVKKLNKPAFERKESSGFKNEDLLSEMRTDGSSGRGKKEGPIEVDPMVRTLKLVFGNPFSWFIGLATIYAMFWKYFKKRNITPF